MKEINYSLIKELSQTFKEEQDNSLNLYPPRKVTCILEKYSVPELIFF